MDIDTEAWIIKTKCQFAKWLAQEAEMQEQTFAAGECPVCGHDWSCHGEFIQKGEKTCVVFDGTGTHTFTFCEQEAEEMDEFTKTAHFCGECGAVYQWSADDIAWGYEKPFMPCGHLWRFLDKPLPVVGVFNSEGEEMHTADHPFCADMRCECHFDPVLWRAYIYYPWLDGLMTIGAAAALYSGR